MRPELFTIRPAADGPLAEFDSDGKIIVTAPPVLHMECGECDWSFRYGTIGLADVLAHAENHSAEHPLPEET